MLETRKEKGSKLETITEVKKPATGNQKEKVLSITLTSKPCL